MNNFFKLVVPRTKTRVWRALGRQVSIETSNLAMRLEAREFLYRLDLYDLDGFMRLKWDCNNDWQMGATPGQFHVMYERQDLERGSVCLVDFDMPMVSSWNQPPAPEWYERDPEIWFHDADRAKAAMFKLAFF